MAEHIHSLTAIFYTKKDVIWPPKKYALIENKTVYLIRYIFYSKKVISCAHMPVDTHQLTL